MKQALRIAGIGLLAGAAMSMAAAPMLARGGADSFGSRGIFATDFATLDANGDGRITEEDFAARAAARLAEADTDGNGKLEAAEIAAQVLARFEDQADRMRGDPATRAEAMAARLVEARDTDDDGALSPAELAPAKGYGRVVDRFDTDDDNAISAAEYDEAKAAITARADKRGMDPRGGHKSRW